ncbi:MAG: CBS domain-containing protein [Sphaerochaetaceae bacterium]|jgi:CBS domain-containing protein/anti-sigma regulatory factor (Ser/Thr protein kinase)|nr:CBS domain-containing protein [Sphaerochaetaceae bacterium]MDD3162719.1 CBS domain-containing protein [Sphaerochaetaceae bacterium]MDD4007060.1 CBS domain-containing protein [Sphaerochaetaceae bacterium]MDD4396694.1 CBS domain-containing protein [Sphaerochaetaceae bacterium]
MDAIPISTYNSATVILELIYRMKVKDVMTRNLITASETDTLRSIQHLMKDKSITGVPIVNGSHLLGLVSVDDIICALDFGYIEDPASKHMTTEMIVLEDDMPVSFAIQYFDRFRFHRFPVLNRSKELVGMVTNRDITTYLLLEINKEVDKLERKSMLFSQEVCLLNQVQSYSIARHDFEKAGYASTQIKKHLKKAGVAPALIRRVAVAAYELEMNIVVHSDGGEIIAEYESDRVTITARDYGPGIPDVGLALQKGYTTADEWTRSLGFGAGMGLPNVQSVSDKFSITSSAKGTVVISTIFLKPQP